MIVGAVVQARMSSSRLPGKVLRPLHGVPLLGWVLDSLASVRQLDEVVVATSTEVSDDPIAAFARGRGVTVRRGPLDDVAGRVLQAAQGSCIEGVVRICADSPLLHPDVIRQVVGVFLERRPDIATNVFPRSFPAGQSVEVFAFDALAHVHDHLDGPQREHVTRWFYENPDCVSIHNVEWQEDASEVRHCVDTAEDAEAVERILAAVGGRPWDAGLKTLIKLSRKLDTRV